jgi:hypothetical protein
MTPKEFFGSYIPSHMQQSTMDPQNPFRSYVPKEEQKPIPPSVTTCPYCDYDSAQRKDPAAALEDHIRNGHNAPAVAAPTPDPILDPELKAAPAPIVEKKAPAKKRKRTVRKPNK